MRNKVLVKQANSMRHICDKVYVDKNMTKVLGVYPYYKKSKNSIYRVALKKCLKESFYRMLVWGIVDIIVFMICCLIIRTTFIIGYVIAAVCIFLNILSAILNIRCFKGKILEKITVTSSAIVSAVNTYCDNISVSDNTLINSDHYKRLDLLSQIADSAKVRLKKLEILIALKNDFEYDWKYETDTVLLKDSKYSNNQMQYLSKVKKMDEDLLGIASRVVTEKKVLFK